MQGRTLPDRSWLIAAVIVAVSMVAGAYKLAFYGDAPAPPTGGPDATTAQPRQP
jgi:hypothetical protein